MSDATETIRRELVAEINAEPGSREYLEGADSWFVGIRRQVLG